MIYFSNHPDLPSEDDSLELLMLALGALAIGLLLGYMLGKHSVPATKPVSQSEAKAEKAPAKKAKK